MRTIVLLACLVTALLAGSCGQTSGDDARKSPAALRQPTEVPRAADIRGEAVQYTLRFDDAAHHYVSVRGLYPAPANADVELSLPVWTPGSYLVREYARNIEDLRVASADGNGLTATKSSKNRWSVRTGASPGLVVEYRIYSRELSVRTNFVDADHAVLNGAPTFLRLVEDTARPQEVQLVLPEAWQEAQSGLTRVERNYFKAQSYDELIDSPILAGAQITAQAFDVEGVPHTIVQLGDSSQWDAAEVLADVQDIVKAELHFWGVIPYKSYSFLNVLLGGGGGLEHLDSTLMMASPFSMRTADRYRSWLALVAHEFFHTWNVKRLRPRALGPFDYESENYTASLWIAEGITSYYADLLMKRAGLLDEQQYLTRLSEQIHGLQTTPGRATQSLSQASQDAWIKHYRRDENTVNSAISYYTKGAVVAFLLDARIRDATGSSKSLDDVMRLMYQRYSGELGYTPENFREAASEVAGEDLSAFFKSAIDSSEELDYQPALQLFGMRFSGDEDDSEDDEDEDEDEPAGWIGAEVSGGRVSGVRRDTPAYSAGLNVNDEILAIDGYRSGDNLDDLLGKFKAGQKVTLTIARHGRLREIPATLGEDPGKRWTLAIDDQQSQLQAERLRQWLAEYDL